MYVARCTTICKSINGQTDTDSRFWPRKMCLVMELEKLNEIHLHELKRNWGKLNLKHFTDL